MKKICCFILAVVFLVACDDDDANENKDTYAYFQKHLNAEMKYPALQSIFGTPDTDIGSGIHIYVYNLEDGTRVLIGFTDTIMYARHVDKDDQLLDTII